MGTTPTLDQHELREQGRRTVLHFFVATLYLFLLLEILIALQFPLYGWGMSLVSLGLFGVGAVAGFLYSVYGDEKQQFSPTTTALTSALGGAGVVDALKEDGMIRQVYHALGCASGLRPDCHGAVLALAAIFGPLGFFTLYFYRKLVINPLQRSSDAVEARLREVEANRTALAPAGEIELDATSGSAVFRSDPAARIAATEWLKREAPETPTFDDLLGDARAHIALGEHASAIAPLEKALLIRPGHGAATLLLAASHVAAADYASAVELLDTIIRRDPGQTPLNAWKLLGYALLFHDPKDADYRASLWRSIEASTKFLTSAPDDLGALLNRACAYAQLGPNDPRARQPLLSDLRELILQAPSAREHVRQLFSPGLDFAEWANDPDVMRLLSSEQ